MQERVMVLRIIENNDHSFSASKTLVVQLVQKLRSSDSLVDKWVQIELSAEE